MKRIQIMIMFFAIFTISIAQTTNKRIQFLGIPLGSTTISTFTEKVRAKGIKIHPNNQYVRNGCRMFEGKYYNQDAIITAFYDIATKKVHQVTSTIHSSNMEKLSSMQEELEEVISDEYSIDTLYTDEKHGGIEVTIIEIVNQKDTAEILISIEPSLSSSKYQLVVDYQDEKTVLANRPYLDAKHVDFSLLGVKTFDNYSSTVARLKQKGYQLKGSSHLHEFKIKTTVGNVEFTTASMNENVHKEVGVFGIMSKDYYIKNSAQKAYESVVNQYRNDYQKYDFVEIEEEILIKNDQKLPVDGWSEPVRMTTLSDEDGHSVRISLIYQSANKEMAEYDEKYKENHWNVDITLYPCAEKKKNK